MPQRGQWLQKPALGTGQQQKVNALTHHEWVYRPMWDKHFRDPRMEGKEIKM